MKAILEHLYQHKTFSKAEAKEILIEITLGKFNHLEIASFLTAFIMRNITLEELKGFREALLELSVKIDLKDYLAMDLCGTGGDGKDTFNISTLASFVAAGAGVFIAKHGNYGVSSVSGSSNVLEALGIKFQATESKLKEQLEKSNICFLHAPMFHPAMKFVAPIRKELGVKTFFNMLGPLVNPIKPTIQMTGVFSLELARMYHYIFQEDKIKYSIVHALDGFDEVSLTASAKWINNEGEKIIDANYFGFNKITFSAIHGGYTVKESAKIFTDVIQGHGSEAQSHVVLANAAIAIQTYRPHLSIQESLDLAKDSLFGLKALQSFNQLKNVV